MTRTIRSLYQAFGLSILIPLIAAGLFTIAVVVISVLALCATCGR